MGNLVNWINERFPLLSAWKKHASEYYVPKNLNFFYYFGFLSTAVLINQLVTGLWLTMFYTPSASQAFASIEYIMRDVNYGWLLRYMHSTGASALLIVVYLHMFRALLYGSYKKPRELVWLLGMAMFILILAEAFCGYLLPWGQMSYWGAQVITSLLSAIPYVGDNLVTWVQGDYHVSDATLHRFFALHVIGIPLLLTVLVGLHIVALHQVGSNNPEGIEIRKQLNRDGKPLDGIPFHPYYTIKDLFGLTVFLIGFFAVVFFMPDMHGYFLEPTNFIPADPMVTPDLITPVWYMTPFYSILRAIPDKLTGVIAMGSGVMILIFLPWLDKSPVKSMRYKGYLSRLALALMIVCFITLGYLGTVPVTPVKQIVARICTTVYFLYFILMPVYSRMEAHRTVPDRIMK